MRGKSLTLTAPGCRHLDWLLAVKCRRNRAGVPRDKLNGTRSDPAVMLESDEGARAQGWE